jgi:hypothetical protein
MTKENMMDLLSQEGVGDFLEIEWPELPALSAGSPTDAALNSYVITEYCNNCNEILRLPAGLKIFDYLLRGLQRSNMMGALVMASLEGVGTTIKSFTVTSPLEGTTYDTPVFPLSASRNNPTLTSLDCLLDNTTNISLTLTGDVFSGVEIIIPGDHIAVFSSAQFPADTVVVDFGLSEYSLSIWPPDHSTITGGSLKVNVGSTPNAGDDVQVSIIQGTLERTASCFADNDKKFWTGEIDLSGFLPGAAECTVRLLKDSAEIASEALSYTIGF